MGQPAPKSLQAFDSYLTLLRDKHGLQIYARDPNLSPEKRQARRNGLSSEQQRIEKIYNRLHYLYFCDESSLSASLDEFERLANAPPPHGQERPALEDLLLDCLVTNAKLKRASPEAPAAKPKRTRLPEDVRRRDAILDSLPVWSGDRRTPRQSISNLSERTVLNDTQPLTVSEYSSRTSAGSSPSNDGYETAQTSRNSRNVGTLDPASARSSPQKPSNFKKPLVPGYNNVPAATEFTHARTRRHSTVIDLTQEDEPGPPPENPLSLGSHRLQPPKRDLFRLEDRLKHTWPTIAEAFDGAPFPVLWEVMRAALDCDIDLENTSLKYRPGPEWEQQSFIRTQLKALSSKSLPYPCDAKAWTAALTNTEIAGRAPYYAVDLAFNEDTSGPLFKFQLQPIKLELNHRLGRRFGSDRFLEVTIPQFHKSDAVPRVIKSDKDANKKLMNWLTQETHYFLGRMWIALFVRDGKKVGKKARNDRINFDRDAKETKYFHQVYLFAHDGDGFRTGLLRALSTPSQPLPPPEEAQSLQRTKFGLDSLLLWAINLPGNKQQSPLKLFSRIQLSLSRTYATVVIPYDQIRFKKADMGEVINGKLQSMNDGAGRISVSLARKIAHKLQLPPEDCPCAFQARFGNAKGMWVIDVFDSADTDWIELYPGQCKWQCDFLDIHHRTFEVKEYPRGIKSGSVNEQFLPLLEAQSRNKQAMRQAIEKHLEACLLADLDTDMTAMKDSSQFRLWLQQYRSVFDEQTSVLFLGGLPKRDEDTLAFLTDSGFDPMKLKLMQDIILKLKKQRSDELKARLNFEIPCSAYMLMIPDFWGILEEGEVHVSFSTQFQVEGFSDTLLENMDVIVGRAPAHFPSDLQRVRAVSREGLRKLKDVIIFSTKGSSSLADKLSGGDYDGDRAWVCWDPQMVGLFVNALVPEKPDLFKEGFLRKSNLDFKELESRADSPGSLAMEFIREGFFFNMQQAMLGLCTSWKDGYCILNDNIESPAAIALSTLLSELVDQAKQGNIFTDADWNRLRMHYIGEHYKRISKPDFKSDNCPIVYSKKGTIHILHHLQRTVDFVVAKALDEFNQMVKSCEESYGSAQQYDADLTRLWCEMDELADFAPPDAADAKRIATKLRKYLRDEIERIEKSWKADIRQEQYETNIRKVHQQWLELAMPQELKPHPFIGLLADSWCPNEQYSNWNLLKASFTYKSWYHRKPELAWKMAGCQLAHIKARVTETPKDSADVLVKSQMWLTLRPDKKVITRRAAKAQALDTETALDEVMRFDDDGSVLDDT